MIDFSLSEEEVLLQDTAKDFAARALLENIRTSETSGPEEKTVQAFDQTGLCLLWGAEQSELPEGELVRCLVLEELGSGDPGTAMHLLLPIWVEQAARYLGVPEEDRLGLAGLHLVEAHNAEAGVLPWTALGEGDKILLLEASGTWRVCGMGTTATPTLGLNATAGGRVELGEVLAKGQADAPIIDELLARLRLYLGSLLVGLSRAALDYAAEYMTQRSAFSRPLAQHQGLAFMVAEMATEIQASRMLVQRASLHLDESKTDTCHQAYLSCAEMALMVTERGVQLLGGHGYMKDHPVELWMREARAITLLWGGLDAAREDAARDAWEMPWT